MSTDTHSQNQIDESSGMNRRAFMRRSLAGASAVGALGYGSLRIDNAPVQNVQANPAVIGVGLLAASTYYITRDAIDSLQTGDDFDEEAYDEASDEQVYNDIYETALTIKENNDNVTTTIENNISLGQNAALSEAKKDAIEQLNLGNGEESALNAAKEANDEYWAVPQENIIRHTNTQMAVFESMDTANDASGIERDELFTWYNTDDDEISGTSHYHDNFEENTVTLKNGDQIELLSYENSDNSGNRWSTGYTSYIPDSIRFTKAAISPLYDRTGFEFFDSELFYSIWNSITENHAEVESELETLIPAYADGYEEGDISLSDIISPSDLANSASNEDGFSYAAADLASLGLSTIGGNWDIRLEESNETVVGTIYLLTNDSLTTGQTYDPDNISGPVYLAYEWESGQFDDSEAGSDLIELQQEFTILGGQSGEWIENEEGEREYVRTEVGEGEDLTFEETYQSTTDTDIESFREELQTLRERNEELEEQRREAAFGGGSFADDAQGFLSSEIYGIPVIGWAIGVAGLGILFGGDN